MSRCINRNEVEPGIVGPVVSFVQQHIIIMLIIYHHCPQDWFNSILSARNPDPIFAEATEVSYIACDIKRKILLLGAYIS